VLHGVLCCGEGVAVAADTVVQDGFGEGGGCQYAALATLLCRMAGRADQLDGGFSGAAPCGVQERRCEATWCLDRRGRRVDPRQQAGGLVELPAM
jgi:hypothetical protein